MINDDYDEDSHIYEYDADCEGANVASWYIFNEWTDFEDVAKKKEILEDLFSIGLSSIITLFYRLSLRANTPTDVYYEKGDHPHPAIRILYTTHMYFERVRHGLTNIVELDYERIISNAKIISNAVLLSNNVKFDYDKILETNYDSITAYIEKLHEGVLKKENSVLVYLHKNPA
ncbi:hypothetical protein [Deminuibacter soli]|uniref:Uncharacterized protein n=1 Tax=Deminuibacter soli TaxID=2291815 RepID=A0A3E1NMF4_9BACT|nr:hypothetical protein [Deminuibacter soli]RFM29109.1 hypothetical protein DXN05_10175 [Deminuibacter soli]